MVLFASFRQVANSSSLVRHFLIEVGIGRTLQMLGNLNGNLDNGVYHQVSEDYVIQSMQIPNHLFKCVLIRGCLQRIHPLMEKMPKGSSPFSLPRQS